MAKLLQCLLGMEPNTQVPTSELHRTFKQLIERWARWGTVIVEHHLDRFLRWADHELLPELSRYRLRHLEQRRDPARPRLPLPAGQSRPEQLDREGLDLIRHFEGFRGQIYTDVAGHPTIGYGHLIRPGEHARFAAGLTKAQAAALLQEDAGSAVGAVRELVQVPLNQNQFNALVSFAYNVGRDKFGRSTLLKRLNQGRYEQVALQLRRWVHARGQQINGLVRRRAVEAQLFNTPVG